MERFSELSDRDLIINTYIAVNRLEDSHQELKEDFRDHITQHRKFKWVTVSAFCSALFGVLFGFIKR